MLAVAGPHEQTSPGNTVTLPAGPGMHAASQPKRVELSDNNTESLSAAAAERRSKL